MDLTRFHLDRVSAYVSTLPDDSGMPWFSEASDHSRLQQALCVAANLHNPDLTAALTKTRSTNESADDLERIADSVDEPTAVSMRRVARTLREYTPEEVR